VERINQLNILRESNATLRAECESQSKRARELDVTVQQLSAQVDPLKDKLRIASAELSNRDQQIKKLEAESRQWKERTTHLMGKVSLTG
jgi:nucleoprotein TPR